jgi:hypothetical protein
MRFVVLFGGFSHYFFREVEEAITAGKDPQSVFPKPVAKPAASEQQASTTDSSQQQQSTQSTQPKPSAQPKSAVSKSVKAALVNPITKYAQDIPEKAPYNFEFIIPHPTGVSALDIDIIKVNSCGLFSFHFLFLCCPLFLCSFLRRSSLHNILP